jgi:hypothetical protein
MSHSSTPAGTITIEQSKINAAAAASAATLCERQRATTILGHPRAQECSAVAMKCIVDGTSIAQAYALLGPVDGAEGVSEQAGAGDQAIAASWDKAFGAANSAGNE